MSEPVTSGQTPGEPAGAGKPPAPPSADRRRTVTLPDLSDSTFVAVSVGIVAVAAALRLYDLPLVPFHHDEGINGFFVTTLARHGTWAYDPQNYHGPTLFFFALATEIIFGLNDTAMRLVPALFGVATVGLVLAMRPFVGPVAALVGGALIAVSPGATYYSRYFIHEAMLVFFTLALVVTLLWYLREGRERYLVLTAVVLALMLATKETAFVTVVVLLIAIVAAVVYVRLRAGRSSWLDGALQEFRAAGRRLFTAERLITAGLVGLIVYVLFFSSFLTNPQGIWDSVGALAAWTQTSGETQVQPPGRYLEWMFRGDPVILVVGIAGGVIAAVRATDRLSVFVGLWALGITLAYSLVSYKVPWIALNIIVPAAILGGIGVRELAERVSSQRLQLIGAAAGVAALAFTAYQSYQLNFVRYDDELASPYVFVHTTREATALVAETMRIGAAAGTGDQTGIVFVSPDYWPLPWYYRDYPRAGFFGTIVDTAEPVIVANVNQDAEIATRFGDRYTRKGDYTLRPGVDLSLYVRNDLVNL